MRDKTRKLFCQVFYLMSIGTLIKPTWYDSWVYMYVVPVIMINTGKLLVFLLVKVKRSAKGGFPMYRRHHDIILYNQCYLFLI